MFLCFFEKASVINLYKTTTALSLATKCGDVCSVPSLLFILRVTLWG